MAHSLLWLSRSIFVFGKVCVNGGASVITEKIQKFEFPIWSLKAVGYCGQLCAISFCREVSETLSSWRLSCRASSSRAGRFTRDLPPSCSSRMKAQSWELRASQEHQWRHVCACVCMRVHAHVLSHVPLCVTPWDGKCRTSWWKISLIHPAKIKSKPLRASHDKLFPPSWLSEWPPLLAKPPQSHLLDSQQASELERNFIACITTWQLL